MALYNDNLAPFFTSTHNPGGYLLSPGGIVETYIHLSVIVPAICIFSAFIYATISLGVKYFGLNKELSE